MNYLRGDCHKFVQMLTYLPQYFSSLGTAVISNTSYYSIDLEFCYIDSSPCYIHKRTQFYIF